MTNEQMMREFNEKGIEVTIYQHPFRAERVVIDTTEHDKQIRAEVIEEFANYLKKNFKIGINTVGEVAREFKEQNK